MWVDSVTPRKGDASRTGGFHRTAVPREEPDGVSESIYGPAGAHYERAVTAEEYHEGAAAALGTYISAVSSNTARSCADG